MMSNHKLKLSALILAAMLLLGAWYSTGCASAQAGRDPHIDQSPITTVSPDVDVSSL